MLRFTDDQQAFIRANRSGFNVAQTAIAIACANAAGVQLGNAETLPRDVWQEWDTQAVTIQREELVIFNDLAASVSRSIPIGKIISNFAKISDSGSVNVSLDGRSKARPDRPTVEYDGVPVPIIDSTFSFGWRMVEAARTDGGMGQLEDAARLNAARRVAERMEAHTLDGNGIVLAGKQAYGLRTHPERATRSTGVTLNGATGPEWVAEVKALMATLHARNFRTAVPTVYFSYDDWFYARSTDFSAAYAGKTIAQRVQELGIMPVAVPNLAADEMIALVKDRRVVTVLSAMPMTTRAQTRMNPEDEYDFVTMMAGAVQFRSDVNGNLGVAHST